MVNLSLQCAIVGQAGSSFDVEIDDSAKVSKLKKAIKEEKPNDFKDVDADKLQLSLAKKGAGWLPSADLRAIRKGEDVPGFERVSLVDTEDELYSTYSIRDVLDMNGMPPPQTRQIHVLVVVPEQAQEQPRLWLVTGSVDNALNTKGIRCRLYRLAGLYLGYYDPVRRAGDKDSALWYEGKTLCIHSLFETKENALMFDNALQDDSITSMSPLNGHAVSTNVASVSRELSELQRIYSWHYVPENTESPQATMISLSSNTSKTSIVDVVSDEFKYQRIESEVWFGAVGKAQSCHVMSRDHCQRFTSYNKYANDPSNRLALSAEMHEWFDARSFAVPTIKISVESTSERFVIGNRYQVNLVVRALNAEFARLIALRLKEGFVVSDDGLEMRTSVYVLNKKVFCECMEWKRKEIEKKWRDHHDMAPAVD